VENVVKNPKGLTFTRSYSPDRERMIRALRALLESEAEEETNENHNHRANLRNYLE